MSVAIDSTRLRWQDIEEGDVICLVKKPSVIGIVQKKTQAHKRPSHTKVLIMYKSGNANTASFGWQKLKHVRKIGLNQHKHTPNVTNDKTIALTSSHRPCSIANSCHNGNNNNNNNRNECSRLSNLNIESKQYISGNNINDLNSNYSNCGLKKSGLNWLANSNSNTKNGNNNNNNNNTNNNSDIAGKFIKELKEEKNNGFGFGFGGIIEDNNNNKENEMKKNGLIEICEIKSGLNTTLVITADNENNLFYSLKVVDNNNNNTCYMPRKEERKFIPKSTEATHGSIIAQKINRLPQRDNLKFESNLFYIKTKRWNCIIFDKRDKLNELDLCIMAKDCDYYYSNYYKYYKNECLSEDHVYARYTDMITQGMNNPLMASCIPPPPPPHHGHGHAQSPQLNNHKINNLNAKKLIIPQQNLKQTQRNHKSK